VGSGWAVQGAAEVSRNPFSAVLITNNFAESGFRYIRASAFHILHFDQGLSLGINSSIS